VRRRRAPRPLAGAVGALADSLRPATGLAAVQEVAERQGTVTVHCASSVWAQEIGLMAPSLCAALNARLGSERVTALRCTARGVRRG
jgi:predicted nucleic acid-binding Zn ribbon protein